MKSSIRRQEEIQNLNNSIDAIRKLIKSALGFSTSTPEDVLNSCKDILKIVSKVIYSGTQQEVAEAANESVDVVDKLLNYAKALSKKAPDDSVATQLMTATNKSAELLCTLLETTKLNKNDPASQAKLETVGEQVTQAVNQIVAALKKYPRQMDISLTAKGENLDQTAEKELMKTHKIIEESVKKLENMRPAPSKTPGSMDEANNGLIDAAITASKATGFLNQCALHAQKERAAYGQTKAGYIPDQVLINGLLTATHGVSTSVQGLVGSSNTCIKNKAQNGEEEGVIASANAIATSTNHLFSASRAKADHNSKIQLQLQQAIKNVAQATAKLVQAAQTYTVLAETAIENDSMAGVDVAGVGVRKELEFQIKILQLEKALQREKNLQSTMKQAKFNTGGI